MNRNPENSRSGPRVNELVTEDIMQNSKLGSVVDGHDDLVYKVKHRFGRFAVEQALLYYSVWENAM
eukprot:scaffold6471_cov114-Cylindrotheca_fusiformis.AAC.2